MLAAIKNRNQSNQSMFLQLGLMMFLTIFTQVIMLLKTSVIASNFGVSVEMDAFNFANSIGTFIFSFIGAGVTTVLIPNLINDNKKEAVNIFMSVLYSVAFVVLILIHINREWIIRILSSGNEKFVIITCNVMFITLITQYINSFSGATNAIFQCSGKFNLPKFITLITSTLLVIFLLLIPNINIYKYTAVILVTTILNIGIQIYLVKKGGYLFRYKIDLKNEEFKHMMNVFAPTVLSTGLYQVSLLTDSIISSNLGAGELSKLSYSNNIMSLVNSVILTNIMTYFYPKIAKSMDKENSQEKLFDLSILINAIMTLIVVGFFTVGRDGVAILYERGKFTSSITSIVYVCTLIYMIGLPTNAFRDLIYRYFYANGDTITPFKNSLIVSFLNIIISIVLSRYIGIYGIILGTVVTSYMSLSMILIRFNRKFKLKYNKKILVLENIKLLLAAFISIICIKFIKIYMPVMNSFLNLIIYGILVVIIYISNIYILRSKMFTVNFK